MIGLRLDKALSLLPTIQSRSRAEALISGGHVLINEKTVKSSYQVKGGDQLQIAWPEPQPLHLQPYDFKLDILFEDSDLLVVNKPAGLVVHPAAGHAQDTLVNALIAHTDDFDMKFGDERPGIVHRLDKETSGVLVVAKNDFSQENLAAQFKARDVHRIYYAATLGLPAKTEGIIQSFLARHPVDRKKFASVLGDDRKIITDPGQRPSVGKWALTRYQVLERSPQGISYLQLKLETGRTHQIRVHLSEMGFPIIGDKLYGADRKLKAISSSHLKEKLSLFPRFALHAAELGFQHPRTKDTLSFKVNWPEDLRPTLKELFKHVA
jgi:23S rRNA pseudouridine1911/1915/1917 synthase